MSNCSRLVLRALILVGVFGLLILAQVNGGSRLMIKNGGHVTMMKHRRHQHKHHNARRVQRQSRAGSKSDLVSYMSSKRKVPNGPDPIHNRRAGNSRQPPGRA